MLCKPAPHGCIDQRKKGAACRIFGFADLNLPPCWLRRVGEPDRLLRIFPTPRDSAKYSRQSSMLACRFSARRPKVGEKERLRLQRWAKTTQTLVNAGNVNLS